CVYTGYTITLDTTQDPSTNAYEQGINCEHTYPQSMGASEEPQKSDMHHLFPCKSNVNSSRGNDPYAEIPDEDTDTWYRNDYSQEDIPSEISNLTNLVWLNFVHNQLTGEIPESICDLNMNWSDPNNFNISENQLCPPYPECIENYVGEQDTSNCEQVSIIDETFPITYKLYNAYPNPFNPVTTIRYDLPENAFVNIRIYDLKGRSVNTLVSKEQTAGYKAIKWAGVDDKGQPVSAGLYLYTIQAGEFRQTKKMVLLK
ncbi:endonuclease, partial [Candidatus Marinimicrobia bacterium]|nr:endonuclease [Candidatus Neomarinimicrobiota bacterium]